MPAHLRPRESEVSIPLPRDDELPPEIVESLSRRPALNNLRMFARVPHCFETLMTFIDEVFGEGRLEPTLRIYAHLRISYRHGLYYEWRHNSVFAERLGIPAEQLELLTTPGAVRGLGADGDLVCKAAEEITDALAPSDETLSELLDRFGTDVTSELVLGVAWFNMLIRYVESMRVPYEDDPRTLITTASPVED